jgi:5-methylcytosine-specific restriction endonuclease McrA
MAELKYTFMPRNVQDIINLYENGQLNLEPAFQRASVWQERDRAKLIDSIVRCYPLPAVFFYKRKENGRIYYDVIDGKQRLESILMFIGNIYGGRYWAKIQLPGTEKPEWHDWTSLRRKGLQTVITDYQIMTIEVDGEFDDITDVFVRINSTGKALTMAEKRHASYYKSTFLKAAAKLAKQYEEYLCDQGVISSIQASRMKHVELMCELMLSIHQGNVLNKKTAIDRIMQSNSLTHTQIEQARSKTVKALNHVRKMLPELKHTRFSKLADFYTLVVLISKFDDERLILINRRRNRLAQDLLLAFSNGVDVVRVMQTKVKSSKPEFALHREYLLTVLQATDEVSQRQKREDILRSLLASLFAKKDINRGFSREQRRIIWNTSDNRKCRECGKTLTWDDFTIDHIKPYSKGGQTDLKNAAILCREHNSSKGNR